MTTSCWIVAIALASGAGCVSEALHARREDLMDPAVADAIARAGAADVPVLEGGTRHVRGADRVHVWVASGTETASESCAKVPLVKIKLCRLQHHHMADADVARDATIAEVVDGCDASRPGHACLAQRLSPDQAIALGSRTHVSPTAVGSFIGAGIMFGAGSYCMVECDAKGAAVGVLGAGLLLALGPLLLLR